MAETKMGNELNALADKVENRLAEMKANSTKMADESRKIMEIAEKRVKEANKALKALEFRLKPYVEGKKEPDDSYEDLYDRYMGWLIERKEMQHTMIMAEEAIAEEELGNTGGVTPPTYRFGPQSKPVDKTGDYDLKKSTDEVYLPLEKGGFPPGTIRTWGGQKYIKLANGKWRPYTEKIPKKIKNLAYEKDRAHSLDMIRRMYARRPKGQGEEMPIASEADLDKILKNTTYSMISAGRNPEDPEDMKLTEAQINERTEAMKRDLTDLGFVITPAQGKYGSPEESFMVFTHDADRDEMMEMGAKYKQDSIVFVKNGKRNEMIFTSGPNKGKADMVGTGYEKKPVKADDDFYTDIQAGSKTIRFTVNFGNLEKAIRRMINRG